MTILTSLGVAVVVLVALGALAEAIGAIAPDEVGEGPARRSPGGSI